MNESVTSNLLGIAGNPSIAESVMVFRDLQISNYVDGLIHIPTVSTSESVKIIDINLKLLNTIKITHGRTKYLNLQIQYLITAK